jgi:hypothetical protein
MNKWLLVFLCLIPSWQVYGQEAAEVQEPKEDIRISDFDSFSKMRFEVLNLVGAAKTRIWLVTDYLTDGEVVSALFLARYRKLDVKVLLGKKKAYSYMSRLGYLRQQNIPVYIKPNNFPSGYPTQV